MLKLSKLFFACVIGILLYTGCAKQLTYYPREMAIPDTHLYNFSNYSEANYSANLAMGSFAGSGTDSVVFKMTNVDYKAFAPYVRNCVFEGLARQKVFADVSRKLTSLDTTDIVLNGSLKNFSLKRSYSFSEGRLITAEAELEANLLALPEKTVLWSTSVKAANSASTRFALDKPFDLMAHKLAAKLINEIISSKSLSSALSDHMEVKVAVEEEKIIDFSALDKLDQASGEKTAAGTSLVAAGNYHALLIGINNYQKIEKLKTPIHDIQVLDQILRKDYGFKTRLLQDPTRAEILTALNNFRNTLKQQDNILIYYAGHGWLDIAGDEGYWFPVDATPKNEINWISNTSITSTIRAMKAKHIMVVADSCYSGKLTRGLHITLNTPDYYSQMARKKARVVLSSGGMEPVADRGGKGGHSVFASAFLKALKENRGIMDGTELFNKIRRPVVLNTDQTPEYADIRKAGHEGGDFLFIRRKN